MKINFLTNKNDFTIISHPDSRVCSGLHSFQQFVVLGVERQRERTVDDVTYTRDRNDKQETPQ